MTATIATRSQVLRNAQIRREDFDPRNSEHRDSLRTFIETGKWGDVQFYAEYPYLSVPEMVLRRMVIHALQNDTQVE
jgi:hypothetical protein